MAFLVIDQDLKLDIPKLEYAEAIFRLVQKNRDYLIKWLPWVEFSKNLGHTEDFFIRAIEGNQHGTHLVSIMLYKNRVVGVASYNKIETVQKRGEIGYWIDADHQGLGLVSKATHALSQYGFQKLNLNRITIMMSEKNKKSKAIPERLGFIYEGTLRELLIVNGTFFNMRMYSMLHSEWIAGKLKMPK